MTNKNISKCSKVFILLLILILAFALTPSLTSGQVAEKSSQDETKISKELATKFLNELGYENATTIQFSTTTDSGLEKGAGAYIVKEEGKSITISVVSDLWINNGDSKSYDYSAQFSSSNGKRYSIDQTYLQVKKGNMTTTVVTEKIVGAMNLYSQVKESKTIGPVVNKQTEGFLKVDNASESYSMNFTFTGTMNHEESVILNGTMILDQNKVEPTGRYIVKCSPKSSQLGYGTKADIILPNGTIIDPGLNWFASGLVSGNNVLYGVYVWWEEIFQAALDIILFILDGLILAGVVTAPFAPLVFGLTAIVLYSSAYCTTMESEYGPIYIMYVSMVCYLGFIPYYGEIGYYSDRLWGVPLGDWYYIPFYSGSWHTCIWPPNLGPVPDPPVTVLCYDEDTSSYLPNIPLTLNGTWSQPSGSTIDVPPGTYIIQVENYGGDSFHYFDVDGTPVYDNPATITVSEEDMTITVHYYYLPYYWVTSIYSYDGDVYNPNNLVGSKPDGLFATIWGYGPYQYYGWISGVMAEPAIGHIYVYGSGSGPLYVYVSSNGYDWNYVSSPYVTSGWIDCGSYLSPFNYILLTAEDPNSVYSIDLDAVCVYPPDTYFTLTISSGSGGSTTPSPSAYQYAAQTPVAVTANPDSGYVLDYWLLDGQNVGTQNPITVTMNSAHTLQANFRTTPYHWLTVDAYDGYCWYPLDANIYIDGNYAGTGYAHVQVTEGWHTIWVDDPVWNPYWSTYTYLWYFTDSYGNGASRPVYSDTYISAVYYPW